MIRPQIHIELSNGKSDYVYYKSYHNHLKRDIKNQINRSSNGEVFVVRSKRGEWGEWTETWKIVNGKPSIVKQGWS